MTATPSANGVMAEAARRELARSFVPVPACPKTKRPCVDQWERLRLDRVDVDVLFPPGKDLNLAVLNGEPSRGLNDVDLDCKEARAAAPYLLPPTGMVWGRRSCPTSHYGYLVDHPPRTASESFDDPTLPEDRAHLLELRSTGGITIIPPSIVPADEAKGKVEEPVVWQQDGDPAAAKVDDLRRAVRRVAAAALLGRYLGNGRRHNPVRALAGGLLRSEWSVADVKAFVRAVAAASGGGDLKDLEACVDTTAERLKADKNVEGWPTLIKRLGPPGGKLIEQVQKWIGVTIVWPGKGRSSEASDGKSKSGPVRYVPLRPFEPFPTDCLPQPWRDLVVHGAKAVGCDVSYIALPALVTMAGAIGATRKIYLGRGWYEPAVLFGAIVGDSGSLKSPALAVVTDPIRERQQELMEKYKRDQAEYLDAVARWEEDKKAFKAKKDGSVDPGERPEPPTLLRVYVSDTTIEKLAEILNDNPRGVLVCRDELSSWLMSFGRYKAKGAGSDLPNWLEMHRAGSITVDRKTGDRKFTFVPRAAVSVIGSIQPGILTKQLTNEFMLAGLGARLLLAMPPARVKKWTDDEIPQAVLDAVKENLDHLYALDLVTDETTKKARPYVLHVSGEAKVEWVRFYDDWARRQAAAEGDLQAAFSKIEGAAARLTLIHYVASTAADKAGTGTIGKEHVEAGVKMARWFAGEAERIYGMLGEQEGEADVRKLVDVVQRLAARHEGRITVKMLHNSNTRKYHTSDDAKAALDVLVDLSLGVWEEGPVPARGGHRPVYFVPTIPVLSSYDSYGREDEDDDGTGDGVPNPPTTGPTAPTTDSEPQAGGDAETSTPLGGCDESAALGKTEGRKSRKVGNNSAEQKAGPKAGQPTVGTTDAVVGTMGPVVESKYVLVTDVAGLEAVTTAVGESVRVGLDCETTGLNPLSDRIRLLTLDADTNDGGRVVYVVDLHHLPDDANLGPLFDTLSTVEVVGHNLQFDLRFLARHGFTPGKVFDTMVASRVLNAGARDADGNRTGHKLQEVVERVLGIHLDKSEQKSDWTGTLTAAQYAYAAHDVRHLVALADALKEKIGNNPTLDLENRTLLGIAWAGPVTIDRTAWLAATATAEANQQRLAGEMDDLVPNDGNLFGGRNWNSTDQVIAAFASVGVTLHSTYDDQLAAVTHPLAARLRDYRAAAKLAGTYGRKWIDTHAPTGVVLPTWNQMGTDTGRMSCSDPNLQQIPRDGAYRRCFTTQKGKVLIKGDFSQIELRTAAVVAGETRMIDAYSKGEDLHSLTAARLIGKAVADVTKGERQVAKAVNFGLLFGMGAPKLVETALKNYDVRLTLDEAKRHKDTFFKLYPDLARWHREVRNELDRVLRQTAGSNRSHTITPAYTVVTRGGRLRSIPAAKKKADGTPYSNLTEALNSGVQGTAADGMKAAIALLWERRADCPTGRPVLFVHDEVVVEVPEADTDTAKAWLTGAMVDGMAPLIDPVPVAVDVTVGRTWGGDA